MKRNIFSVLLVCLMIVSVLLLSGCKTDELEAQMNENASAAEGAVSDAISKAESDVNAAAKKAAADLAAAQEELEALIADGNVANADALDAAVENFNAAIAEADAALADLAELCADNDEALAEELADIEAELMTAIDDATQAVAGAAAQNLAAVKAELLAVIAEGNYATSEELSAAVAEAVEGLASLIATVQKADMSYADSLKAELDTKLSAAIEAVADAASKDLEAATAALEALIAEKADAADVEAANVALQEQITALDAVHEALLGAENADLAEIGNLKTYIATAIANAKTTSDAAYIVVENWEAATAALVDAVATLGNKYYGTYRALYYAENLVELDVAYDQALVALSRSVNEGEVATNLAAAIAALDAVDTKADIIYADLTAKGATVADVVRNDEWNDIITAAETAIAAETDAKVVESLAEVKALAEAFRTRYDALASNEAWADLINNDVLALIAAIEANGYTAANKAEYEDIKADIAAWDEATGAANAELIDRAKVAELDEDYAAAKADYEADAADIKATLEAFTGEYVYNYNADLAAINTAKADYEAWVADVTARGFDLTGETEKAVADVYATFAAGAYARAQALETAATKAAAIEAKIEWLTTELSDLKVVRSSYQTTLADIKAAAKTWDDTYFADPFAAEAVAGNANYDILDHAAVAEVEALYNEVMAEIMRLAEELKAALAEIEKIDIFSGADIDAASAAYTAFTNWLADLSYEIEGLDDTATITNTIASKTVEFKALAAAAVVAYDALAVVDKDDVTLASAADIADLIAWFDTYFGLDIEDADSALPVDKVVLDATHTVDATTVADAKAAVAAFDELTEAKAAEFATLKAELEALVAKTASTALRAEIDTALANYAAWLAGSNAPDGYVDAQFIPVNPTDLDTLKADLDTLNTSVKNLEAQRDVLINRIKALVVDYETLNTTALQTEAQNVLDTLNADIKAFTTLNDGVDCFADYADTLKAAQIAINQAKALTELVAAYDALIAKLAGIADANVVNNMTARADAALSAAEIAVVANYQDGIDLAYANFELFDVTIDEYSAALVAAGTDATKIAKVYEAYVLLDNRDDMEDASQLADESNIVAETFAAVLA